MAYDATVLAGTQGMRNHQKTDRMLRHRARRSGCRWCCSPKAAAAGRATSTCRSSPACTSPTFASFARLSGQVPVVGIVAGRCFAGNAALLGCCDVIIATAQQQHRHGRPGDGRRRRARRLTRPRRSGRATVQSANGVIDVLVADEARGGRRGPALPVLLPGATAARRSRGRPCGAARGAAGEPGARLRHARGDDAASPIAARLLELRAGFGVGIHTALARIDGRPVGLLASNPAHLGGAIDADAADKAARFMQLCNAHGLPIVSLVDTPGFMVGPEIETQRAGAARQPDVRRRRAPARAVLRASCCARATAWARWR